MMFNAFSLLRTYPLLFEVVETRLMRGESQNDKCTGGNGKVDPDKLYFAGFFSLSSHISCSGSQSWAPFIILVEKERLMRWLGKTLSLAKEQ